MIPVFENIYDKYSPMLYSIALQLCHHPNDADHILVHTFLKFHQQNVVPRPCPSLCISLIKLLIQTAHQQLQPGQLKKNVRLKQFEKTPLLHTMLCQQLSVESYCLQTNHCPAEVKKEIRQECQFFFAPQKKK